MDEIDHHSQLETVTIESDKIDTPNPTSEQVQVIVAVGLECIPTEYEVPSTSGSEVQTPMELETANGDDIKLLSGNPDQQPHDLLHDSPSKPRRKSYDSEYKLYVAELAEKFSNRSVARVFNIDDKRVREWRKQKDKLAKVVESETANQISSDASKKKRSYNAEFKLQAVDIAEKSSNRAAARAVNVHEKRIREWRKQKELLQQASTSRKRLGGGGRKPLYSEFEDKLFEWIMAIKDEQEVTRMMVQKKALELSCESISKFPKFSASRGWLDNFLRRKGLVAVGKSQNIQLFRSKFITDTDIDIDRECEITGNDHEVTGSEVNLSALVVDLGKSLQGPMDDANKQLAYTDPLPSMAISSHLVSVAMDEILTTSGASPITETMSIPAAVLKVEPIEVLVSSKIDKIETVPAQTLSAETATTKIEPTETMSTETMSRETVPTVILAMGIMPTETLSIENIPTESVPKESVTIDPMSVGLEETETLAMKNMPTETLANIPTESVPKVSVTIDPMSVGMEETKTLALKNMPTETLANIPTESVPKESVTIDSMSVGLEENSERTK